MSDGRSSAERLAHTPAPPARSTWRRRVGRLVRFLAIAGALYYWFGPRPAFLPLATSIDGPDPSRATGVLVYLHGRGGSLTDGRRLAARLRQAGLASDVAIVLVEAPFSTGAGHQWGHTPEEQATSRARLRGRLRELLGANDAGGLPPARVVVAGFSQGAGLAIDTAVEEPRFGAVGSFSPCLSSLRGELPKQAELRGLRILLAHGARDDVCPVEESRSLSRALDAARRPVQYIEFDGAHTVPAEVVRALVALF